MFSRGDIYTVCLLRLVLFGSRRVSVRIACGTTSHGVCASIASSIASGGMGRFGECVCGASDSVGVGFDQGHVFRIL